MPPARLDLPGTLESEHHHATTKERLRVDEIPTGLGSAHEVAEFLKVNRPTVYNLMARGKLRSVKIGGARRIPWAEVRRTLEEGSSDAP